MADDPIRALREALAVTPDNVPLRRHLAGTLADYGRFEEAEVEFRSALKRAPEDEGLKLGLASAFFRQGKTSAAIVIVEELIRRSAKPARAYLLHARILFRAAQVEAAVREYKKALDADPECADDELGAKLGVRAPMGGVDDGRDPEIDGIVDDDDDDEVIDGKVRGQAGGGDGAGHIEVERPKIDFSHVGGMEAIKQEIRRKIIHPIEHPELYAAYGKKTGGGVLLYGPPGCGKTWLARATAGEVKASFLSVGIHDVLEMWIGNSERNLHAIFEEARRGAPSVLFFDEVDALGASRSDMKTSAGRHTINQLLAELDGDRASNDGVLVLGATNTPWHVDAAFRRPGRFDNVLFVPPPDHAARVAILEVHCRGKPLGDVDLDKIAKKTERYSGADLKAIVDAAIDLKLDEAIRTGKQLPIGTKDLLAAAKRVKPSTREWFDTARNHVLYANQSGLYDDLKPWLGM